MRLGCDPEVFLIDPKTGQFVSAIGLIGGSKHVPLQVEGMKKGFTLQEDNVALEFGIPPASSSTMFVKHVLSVMEAGLNKVPELDFSKLSCVKFPKEQLQHPCAQIFGCEPDYNAWTGKENPKPTTADKDLRTAGGHVHIETKLNPNLVGQAGDLFLAIPAMLMDKMGNERRKLYGQPGAIRYKPYGVEYRVLSNFWIFNEKHIRWVWSQCKALLKFVEEGNEVPDGVAVAIAHNDLQMAKYFVKEYKLNVC